MSQLFKILPRRMTKATLPTYATNGELIITTDTNEMYVGKGPSTPVQLVGAAQVQTDWNASSGLGQLLNKPSLFSGAYADLSGKPSLFSGAYADLSGTPSLFSGAYADLSGKPSLFSGAYTDLSGTPTLAATIAAVSHKFLTSYTSSTGAFTAAQPAYTDISGTPSLAAVATTGAYSDLSGKPSIPTAFTWDVEGNAAGNLTLANAGYTSTFNQTSAVAWLWANTTAAAVSSSTALVASGTAATGISTTVTLNTSQNGGANLLVACVSAFAGAGTVSDSENNTWTLAHTYSGAGGSYISVYYAVGGVTSTSHVFTVAGSHSSMAVYAFSGASPTSTIGVFNGNTSISSNSFQPGSVTPTLNDIVVTSYSAQTTETTPSINSSFTGVLSQTWILNQNLGVGAAYLLGAAASPLNPTWTVSANGNDAAVIVCFHSGNAANNSSPLLNLSGQYWNGSSSVADSWSIQDVLLSGINPTSTLTFAHSGSSGVAQVSIPAFTNILSYGDVIAQNTIAATSTSLNASPFHKFEANYWTGSLYALDTWSIGSALAAGTNGISTLTFTHSGSTGAAVVSLPKLLLTTSSSPTSSGTGTTGQIAWDTSYIYVCTATNTWKRAALTGGY